jgi:hypothetical protein
MEMKARRTLMWAAVLCGVSAMGAASVAQGANIYVVTDSPANEANYEAFLESPAGGGHDVTVSPTGYGGNELTPAEQAMFNSYDLVVISSNISSAGDYGKYPDGWNALTAPVLVHHRYLVGINNIGWGVYAGLGWVEAPGSASGETNATVMKVLDETHPLLDGVTVSGGRVTIYSAPEQFGAIKAPYHATQGLGNATDLILERTGQSAGNEKVFLARWEAGVPFYTGGETPPAVRMFYGGVTAQWYTGDPLSNMTDDGKQLLANVVNYAVGAQAAPIPEPLTACAVAAGLAGLGGYLRRRRAAG